MGNKLDRLFSIPDICVGAAKQPLSHGAFREKRSDMEE